MSDARRRAEEALAHYETCPGGGRWRECSSALAVALRALLAAEPETGEMGSAVGYLARVNQPAPPAPDAVREAAKRLWYRLTPPANVTENGCVFVPTEDLETVLRALRATASPAPGSEEVREAEAVLAEAREALDEIRRRSTDKLAGGIAASFLGAHPRAALRGGQKGEGR